MESSGVQLRLLSDPPFSPLRAGGFRYVPALLDLRGERDALAHAGEPVWDRCTPLVQVTPPGLIKKADVTLGAVVGWTRRLAEAVGHHPIFLDTIGVRDDHRVKGRRLSVLYQLHESARQHGLHFVPVVSVVNGTGVDAATHSAAADGRGVALRLRVAHIGADTSASALMTSCLERLRITPGESDALIDFGYLRPDDE